VVEEVGIIIECGSGVLSCRSYRNVIGAVVGPQSRMP
jgi:hypothetical protein